MLNSAYFTSALGISNRNCFFAAETCNMSILIIFLEQKIENQSSERLVFERLDLFKKRDATTALLLFWKREKMHFSLKALKGYLRN